MYINQYIVLWLVIDGVAPEAIWLIYLLLEFIIAYFCHQTPRYSINLINEGSHVASSNAVDALRRNRDNHTRAEGHVASAKTSTGIAIRYSHW